MNLNTDNISNVYSSFETPMKHIWCALLTHYISYSVSAGDLSSVAIAFIFGDERLRSEVVWDRPGGFSGARTKILARRQQPGS